MTGFEPLFLCDNDGLEGGWDQTVGSLDYDVCGWHCDL